MTTPAATDVINPDCDLSLLVIAALEHAKREARKGDRAARVWLKAEGVLWADAIGIHPETFQRWAAGRKPKRTRRKADPRRWDKYKPKIKTAQESPQRKKTHDTMPDYAA